MCSYHVPHWNGDCAAAKIKTKAKRKALNRNGEDDERGTEGNGQFGSGNITDDEQHGNRLKMDCCRFTTELDLCVIKFGLKQNVDNETFADQLMICMVEVVAKVGKDVKTGAGTNIIGAASEATGTPSSIMGVGVSDVSIDGGVEGRIILESGRGFVYGTGIFKKQQRD